MFVCVLFILHTIIISLRTFGRGGVNHSHVTCIVVTSSHVVNF